MKEEGEALNNWGTSLNGLLGHGEGLGFRLF